jgi:hypothetical protein
LRDAPEARERAAEVIRRERGARIPKKIEMRAGRVILKRLRDAPKDIRGRRERGATRLAIPRERAAEVIRRGRGARNPEKIEMRARRVTLKRLRDAPEARERAAEEIRRG